MEKRVGGIELWELSSSMEPMKLISSSKNLKKKVSIKIKGQRATTFHEVVVRADSSYRLAFHIDTDEANAAGVRTGAKGRVKNGWFGKLTVPFLKR